MKPFHLYKSVQRVAFAHGYFTHELGHILFCRYFNGYVRKVNWSVLDGHEVMYDSVEPNEITWISYAPLFLNLVLAILVSFTAHYLPLSLVVWIVVGLLATSIPSPRDLDEVVIHHREPTLVTNLSERVLPYVRKWHIGYNFAIGIISYILVLVLL
jgi:hypothetical protein